MMARINSKNGGLTVNTRNAVSLRPVQASGWVTGFDNLLRKEMYQWWGTRNWLALLLFLIVMMDGVTVLAGGPPSQAHTAAVLLRYTKAISVFFTFGPLFAAVRVITSTQGSVIDEKQSGTAAWVLSKPASRIAFIGAKLVASAVTFVALGVLAPSLIFYGLCIPMWGRTPDPAAYAATLPVLALHVLFYVALTLLLGTFLNARGAVAAIASAVAFVGSFVGTVIPKGAELTPWGLPHLGLMMATGQPLPGYWGIALASTVVLTVVCVGATIWCIGREEF